MTVKKLAIIGGTGRVGKQVITQALSRGYHLRVLARDATKVSPNAAIEVVQGDALKADSLNELLQGVDAVVSTLGPAGMNTSIKAAKASAKQQPCFNSTKLLLPLMVKHGINRFVLTGGLTPSLASDRNGMFINGFLKHIAPRVLGDIYIDRRKEYQLLKDSQINWTVARCGMMDDSIPTGKLKMNSETFQGFRISTQHIATFLLDQVESSSFSRKGVFLAND